LTGWKEGTATPSALPQTWVLNLARVRPSVGQGSGLSYLSVVRDAAGNLYGTTFRGGPYQNGTVYQVDPSGNETLLHSFTGGADGGYPAAGLVMDAAGNLYGTASFVVFKLVP
jgi:uncharacterized repeat protein (TIGR03803 family)